MGQCQSEKQIQQVDTMEQAVSIEKVKNLSSNATLAASRYHLQSKRGLLRDYHVDGRVLGQGLCGDVVLARGRVDGRPYALKTIRKPQVSQTKLKQLTAEVEIYLTLDHPNIARLHNVYESEREIALLTEYCAGGELYARLQKRGVYTNDDAAEATRQMLRVIVYLHSNNIVHRDLKLENFLYESEEDSAQMKLIDFGFAKIWDPSTLMMASCGSIAYVSPDVLTGHGYTSKCDLWSLGVIVFMLLSGYPPFHGEEKAMMRNIKHGAVDWSHSKRWKPVCPDAIDLVKQLLSTDPRKRPDALTALQHRWLTANASAKPGPALSTSVLRSLQSYADASKVRRAVLQLLALELGPEETDDLRETFLSIDKSNKGTICLRDLKDAIRNGGPRTPTRRRTRLNTLQVPGVNDASPQCGGASPASTVGSPTVTPARQLRRAPSGVLGELFNVLDANGDERIYYSDFLAATLEARSQLREEAVRTAFARLDADQSGTIGVADLRAVLGNTFEGVTVEELLREADLDSLSGEIGFEEFLRVLEDRDATTSPTGWRAPALATACVQSSRYGG